MNIRDFMTGLRRHVLLITMTVLLGAGIAMAITMLRPEVYESRATVLISAPQHTERLDQAYQGTLYTQERVRSYADLVTTPTVTGPSVRELGLRLGPDELAGRLTVSVPVDTALLNITAHDQSPAMAARIADAVTRNLIAAVAVIEAPDPDRAPAIRLSIVREGSVPDSPSSPRPVLNLCLGLVLGAIAGLAAGMAKDALDTRIVDTTDLARVSGDPVLGEIPFDPGTRKTALVDDADRFGRRAEAYRKLRTNLRFVNVDAPPRSIVVTSPLPEDGKSTTAMNLAFSLADDGARVVLVDADLRKPSIADCLGLVAEAGLTSVLSGQAEVADVMQQARRRAAISVLTTGPLPPNPAELLGATQMTHVMGQLAKLFDYVIVDASPLLPVADAAIIASRADGALVVTRSGTTRRDELRRALGSLQSVNARVLGLVVNRAMAAKNTRYGYGYYAAEVTEELTPAETPAGAGQPAELPAEETVREDTSPKETAQEEPARSGAAARSRSTRSQSARSQSARTEKQRRKSPRKENTTEPVGEPK